MSAVKRIAIIAALPGELKPLVKGWVRVAAEKDIHQWELERAGRTAAPVKWVPVCAGIGRDAVTRAFAAAEREGPLAAVVSIGWAGGLVRGALPGTVVPVAWVVDAKTGERFDLATAESLDSLAGLVTAGRVADVHEKARLAAAYQGAQVVDMEAATVARLASMRGIPAYCFKGVSDGVGDSLPDLNPYVDARGQFHAARFVASVAVRPQYWPALRAFGSNSRAAAEELGRVVRKFLNEYD